MTNSTGIKSSSCTFVVFIVLALVIILPVQSFSQVDDQSTELEPEQVNTTTIDLVESININATTVPPIGANVTVPPIGANVTVVIQEDEEEIPLMLIIAAVVAAAVIGGAIAYSKSRKSTTKKAATKKFCGKCGAAIDTNYKFCRKCGKPLPKK